MQKTAFIHPRQRSPAATDLDEVDNWSANRQSFDEEGILGLKLAVLDIGCLGRGAAHVERDHVRKVAGLGKMGGSNDSAGWAGFDGLRRSSGSIPNGHRAAA